MVSKWRVAPNWRNGGNEDGHEEEYLSAQGHGLSIQGDEAINTTLQRCYEGERCI